MSNIQNVTANRGLVQVDGKIVNQNYGKQQTQIVSLGTGDRVSGKILSMSNDSGNKNAQIKLLDNTVISAKLSDGMSLKEGQYVSFEVRGTSDSHITLTPLYENTSVDPTALKALFAAGLEPTEDNLSMVRSMMENGMPIDKESLNSMQQVISLHPNTESSTLVQMKALNIPITEENIKQFESYKNYEHQMVETMDSIMDDLPEAYNSLAQNGEGKNANNLYGDILKMISEGYEQIEQATTTGNSSVAVAGEDTTITEGAFKTMPQLQGFEVQTGETTTLQSNTMQNDMPLQATENLADSEEAQIKLETEENISANASKDFDQNAGKAMLSSALSEIDEVQLNNVVQNTKSVTVSGELAMIIKDLQQNTGFSGAEIAKLITASNTGESVQIDQAQLMKELAEAYTQSDTSSESAQNAFSKLFSNDDFNKIMKDAIKDQWLLDPKDVSSKENVEALYNRLNAQVKQLTGTLTEALGADSKIAQSATGLQNNINFMNQLNEMFNYIQLPLKMSEQDTHGELYVYSNGKRKFEPGETVSAILHLDMDNLGPLDVYVKMKDKNVKTNFYVADEATIDLIEDHIDILNERLNKRGYNMEAKMMLHTDMDDDSEDAAVSEMLNVKKMPVISMQSFDARA